MSAELLSYFPALSPAQLALFAQLPDLYRHWNAQINVISRQDVDNLMERHVLHSLAIAKVQPFANGATILDVGTGGGFPGIPLAIMYPEVEFHLVDSIGKKIKVVQEVAAALGLKNVQAYHKRAEQVDVLFDFAVSRAVAPLAELISWTKHNAARNSFHTLANGLICLKGGDLTEELNQSGAKGVLVKNIADFYQHPFFETKKVVYAPYR
jgi:16S rRNA (guanine527-N7)-methyltransferase